MTRWLVCHVFAVFLATRCNGIREEHRSGKAHKVLPIFSTRGIMSVRVFNEEHAGLPIRADEIGKKVVPALIDTLVDSLLVCRPKVRLLHLTADKRKGAEDTAGRFDESEDSDDNSDDESQASPAIPLTALKTKKNVEMSPILALNRTQGHATQSVIIGSTAEIGTYGRDSSSAFADSGNEETQLLAPR